MRAVKTKFVPTVALIAEDYEINRDLLQEMLHYMDISVDTASDGEEALSLLERYEYDILFLDLWMPKIDGYEVARRVRKMKKKQPVIVAITANAMEGERERCLSCGMDDYICKPVEIHNLEELLRRFLPTA